MTFYRDILFMEKTPDSAVCTTILFIEKKRGKVFKILFFMRC